MLAEEREARDELCQWRRGGGREPNPTDPAKPPKPPAGLRTVAPSAQHDGDHLQQAQTQFAAPPLETGPSRVLPFAVAEGGRARAQRIRLLASRSDTHAGV